LKLNTLFNNQKKLVDTLSGDERRSYYYLLFTSFLSVLLELFGLAIIYLVLVLVLSPSQFLEVIESLTFGRDIRFSVFLTVLLVLFLSKTIAALMLQKKQLNQLFSISASLSDRVFNQSFTSSLEVHSQVRSSERLTDMNTVTNSLPYLVIIPAISALSEIVFVLLTVILLLIIKPLLVFILILALLPQTLLLLYWGRKKLSNTGDEINKQLAAQNQLVSSSVFGFAEINLFNLSNQYKNELSKVRGIIYDNRTKVQLYGSIAPQRVMELLTVIALSIIAAYVYKFNHVDGLMNTLALFAAAAFRMLPSLNRIVTGTNTLNSFESILDLVPAPFSNKPSIDATHYFENFKSLKIKELKFNFSEKEPLFTGIDLSIDKGDFIGIYGASGVGKTTLINIILGFYELPNQQILVNGLPMHEVKRSWQDKLGYVKQDTFLMSDTIKNNIAFGSDVVDNERVISLLKQVKLWEWVKSLPKDVETSIGENGTLISGGQKQRLAIARALYRDAEVLICDEITTALDDSNKQGIWDLLTSLHIDGTTIVLISHDLSAFKLTDRAYELLKGWLRKVD
jgi:ATP-binding cassette, subfamily B, bacterial PglK